MQALAKPAGLISVEEYLEGERASDVRHEFVDGRVYAMAGASDDHNRIVLNLSSELRVALRGRPCEPFATDMKVKIPALTRALIVLSKFTPTAWPYLIVLPFALWGLIRFLKRYEKAGGDGPLVRPPLSRPAALKASPARFRSPCRRAPG